MTLKLSFISESLQNCLPKFILKEKSNSYIPLIHIPEWQSIEPNLRLILDVKKLT